MRLLDAHLRAGVSGVFGDELFVEVAPQFARRVVADVQQFQFALRGGAVLSGQPDAGADKGKCKQSQYGRCAHNEYPFNG